MPPGVRMKIILEQVAQAVEGVAIAGWVMPTRIAASFTRRSEEQRVERLEQVEVDRSKIDIWFRCKILI